MGNCQYCGKSAGFLRSKHIECEKQRQERERVIQQNVELNDEVRDVFDRMLGIDKGASATPAEKQESLKKLESRLNNLGELTANIAYEFEKYCHKQSLRPVAPILQSVSSAKIESMYFAFIIISLCLLEKQTSKALFEYAAYQQKISVGMCFLVSKKLDLEAEKIADYVNNPKLKNVSGEMRPKIEASVKEMLQLKYKVARNCLDNQQNGKEYPLLPLYESIAPFFGGKTEADVLEKCFGQQANTLLNKARSQLMA